MIKFNTENGSIYEYDGTHVRRVNEDSVMRADGEWVRVFNDVEVKLGEPVVFELESLASLGLDSYETQNPGDITFRTTSPVERIWA